MAKKSKSQKTLSKFTMLVVLGFCMIVMGFVFVVRAQSVPAGLFLGAGIVYVIVGSNRFQLTDKKK